jgi:hypothetical protein
MSLSRRPFLALAGVGLLGEAPAARAAGVVRGSGASTSAQRDVAHFAAIAVGGPFKVVVRPAAREGVTIVADDNVLPLIETTLRGSGDERTLQIEFARNTRVEPRTPIVVTVDVLSLTRLALGGAGSIEGDALKTPKLSAAIGGAGSISLANLDAGELVVAIGGSGSFRADGRAPKLVVDVAGSGKCDTERVAAADVKVSIAGSGDAHVRADDALSVSIAGSGDVYHSGAAKPHVAIVGSGRVRPL